jgi:hypothetical protein
LGDNCPISKQNYIVLLIPLSNHPTHPLFATIFLRLFYGKASSGTKRGCILQKSGKISFKMGGW